MKNRGGNGVPVRFVQCATVGALDAADDAIESLLDDGWPFEAVALLATYRRHPEQAARQKEGAEAYWSSWDNRMSSTATSSASRGLERPAVVLAVNGFRDETRAREMLYVGLSRGRDQLVICCDLEMIRRVGGEAVAHRLVNGKAEGAPHDRARHHVCRFG